jgi:hypothetical protein
MPFYKSIDRRHPFWHFDHNSKPWSMPNMSRLYRDIRIGMLPFDENDNDNDNENENNDNDNVVGFLGRGTDIDTER